MSFAIFWLFFVPRVSKLHIVWYKWCRTDKNRGNSFAPKTVQYWDFTRGKIAYRNRINLHWKAFQNDRIVINSNDANFHEKAPTHVTANYAIRIFIKISRTGLPGNRVKIYIPWDSATLIESESLFGYQNISIREKLLRRNSAYHCTKLMIKHGITNKIYFAIKQITRFIINITKA